MINNFQINKTFFCLFLLLLPVSAFAEFEYKGFTELYEAAATEKGNEIIGSRVKVRFEPQLKKENVSAFISLNATKNNTVAEDNGFELREAYVDYFSEFFNMRAGRQLIIWGRADGLQVNDIVSPRDYKEFYSKDFDELRKAVNAVNIKISFGVLSLEAIWLPVFTTPDSPLPGNPWYRPMELDVEYNTLDADYQEPDKKMRNSEYGGKASLKMPGFDFALYYFDGWDDYAVMNNPNENIGSNTLSFDLEHKRYKYFGMEMSKPISSFVFRAEGGYSLNRFVDTKSSLEGSKKHDIAQGLIGVDWNPGHELTVSLQFYDVYVTDYRDNMVMDKNSIYVTVLLTKQFLRQTVRLYSYILYGYNNKEYFTKTYLDYSLTDDLHVIAGVDLYEGGEEGLFGRYSDNSTVWINCRYTF